MMYIILNGDWMVRQEEIDCIGENGYAKIKGAKEGWMTAKVPGEIHLDLMREGKMPEVSSGRNMPQCRWPESKSWWYRTSFTIDEDFLDNELQQLVFEGLDLYAQVFVNGKLVGESRNALIPIIFDVKGYLKTGNNELIVRLTCGNELVDSDAAKHNIISPLLDRDNYRHRMWAGRKWLRKPQFSYGWDWVDVLPNIGIWRDVRLEGYSYAMIRDIRIDTLLEGKRVAVELEAVLENLHPWSERSCSFELEIYSPENELIVKRVYQRDILPGILEVNDMIEIPDARLWWPNGMGEQPLYRIVAKVFDKEGKECHAKEFLTGLRTIEIDQSPLVEGKRFCIRVNGQDVFCRGANIGPHDAILARITDDKYKRLVSEAQNANMNMIRINGCSIYESKTFYDACDRAGILVWQDFMFTCTDYPEDNEFLNMARVEAEAVIRLLRHHPSIALWCGNNEINMIFGGNMFNVMNGKKPYIGGWKIFNQILPEVCRHLDPRRPFRLSSPSGGENPNSELQGNCHWYPFMDDNMDNRIRPERYDVCRSRFVTEYGAIGPCHLDSIREYLSPEEMDPNHPSWQVHTNLFEKDTLAAGIRLHYTDPENMTITEYVKYGQLFQAILHGYAMEALRFRKYDPVDDCQGALIWSFSDCWGETGWSIIDYYLRRKPSYYWFRRACKPVKVIVRQRGDRLITRIVNDTLEPVTAEVETGWWRLDGTERRVKCIKAYVNANSMLQIDEASMVSEEAKDASRWVYAAVLKNKDGTAADQSIIMLLPFRQLEVCKPEIKMSVIDGGRIEVSSPVFCHAVHVEDHGRELISDNWFDLLPGIPVIVNIADMNAVERISMEAVY